MSCTVPLPKLDLFGDSKPAGTVGHVSGFAGIVVADEPRAAMIGRDVLSAGGNPADAAVAAAFALAVTLPSQTGLGAGGVCTVYDRHHKTVDSVNFVAPPRLIEVPALTRGLYVLYARRGGGLPWSQLIEPAERMARLGQPISRALAGHLAALPADGLAPAAHSLFSRPDGQYLREGDELVQPALGATLARIRAKQAAALYGDANASSLAKALLLASPEAPTQADIVRFEPVWRAAAKFDFQHDGVFFPNAGPQAVGEGQLWNRLLAVGDAPDAAARLAPLQDLVARQSPQPATAATGLAVIGRDGSAVACDFSLGRMFGSGRLISEFGFLAAAGPLPPLQPMLAIDLDENEFRFAVAAPPISLEDGRPQGLAAIACGNGAPNLQRCRAASDARGAGLVSVAGGD